MNDPKLHFSSKKDHTDYWIGFSELKRDVHYYRKCNIEKIFDHTKYAEKDPYRKYL